MILSAEQHRKVKGAVQELVDSEQFDLETHASRGSQLGNLEILCEKILAICNVPKVKEASEESWNDEDYLIEREVFRRW